MLKALYAISAEDERRLNDTFYNTLNIHWGVIGVIFGGVAYIYGRALDNFEPFAIGTIAFIGGLLLMVVSWSGLAAVGRTYRRLTEAICFRALIEERLGMTDNWRIASPTHNKLDMDRILWLVEFTIRAFVIFSFMAVLLAVIGHHLSGIVEYWFKFGAWLAACMALLAFAYWQINVRRHKKALKLHKKDNCLLSGSKALVPWRQASYRRQFDTPHEMYQSALIQDSLYMRARVFFILLLLLGFIGVVDGLGIAMTETKPFLLPWPMDIPAVDSGIERASWIQSVTKAAILQRYLLKRVPVSDV